jgi:hypothetical protein
LAAAAENFGESEVDSGSSVVLFVVVISWSVRSVSDGYADPDTDVDGAKRCGEIELSV